MKKSISSLLLKVHPIHRILISLSFGVVAFGILWPCHLGFQTTGMVLWNVFALVYVLICCLLFFMFSASQISKHAQVEDGSRIFVIALISLASVASLFHAMLLIMNNSPGEGAQVFPIVMAVCGMLLSWIIVHATFCFHYAHLYYNEKIKGGLAFPNEQNPDYLDFAYFSFVIGMTFQVSDVEITSRSIRRMALIHGLLAFVLNTFVVALTVNIIAGLQR